VKSDRGKIVRMGLLLGVILILNGGPSTGGQEPALPAAPSDADAKEVRESIPSIPAETADREQARRGAFFSGVVMLGGILICGVGLIAVVLLWGNRTRRMARQSLPKVAPRDELWYLKHKIESDPEQSRKRSANGDSSTESTD
jgi:hypothetical protein